MSKIVKNYIYNFLYQILVIAVPIITAPYLARTLGADALGEYSYVNSLTATICSFVLMGIYHYGNRQIAYVRNDPAKIDQVFWGIMSARLLIALLGTVVYFVVVFAGGKYTVLFCIYYTYLVAYFIDCTWLYVGVEDMKWAVIKNALTKIIAVACIFLFVHTPADLNQYVLIQGGSICISNLLAYTQLSRFVGKPKLVFRHIKKDILGSLYLFLPGIASMLYLQCDKIMIEWITDSSRQVAFYDYSEKIVTIPLTFITVLSTVMMPRIAFEFQNGKKENIERLLIKATKVSLFMALPMVMGLMSICSKFVPWYLGKEFQSTILSIIIISPIVLSNTLSGIAGSQYFTATNQIHILIKSQFTGVVGNLIVNALLIPRYGYLGAAVATVVTSMLCALLQLFYLNRQIRIVGVIPEVLKYLLFSCIMMLVITLLTQHMAPVPLTTIIQITIGLVVYFALCLVSHDQQIWYIIDTVAHKMLKK